jgi:hypothetical protein
MGDHRRKPCDNALHRGKQAGLSPPLWLGDKIENKMVGKVMRDSWKDRLSFPFKDTAILLNPLSLTQSREKRTLQKEK